MASTGLNALTEFSLAYEKKVVRDIISKSHKKSCLLEYGDRTFFRKFAAASLIHPQILLGKNCDSLHDRNVRASKAFNMP